MVPIRSLASVLIPAAVLACRVPGGAARADYPEKVVIAHRGASGYLPEHTLEGYAMAVGQGADFIEPDLVLTKDGVLVALHDLTLDATTDVVRLFPGRARDDGLHYAADFTLEEIKRLAVRERINPGTGEPVFPGRFSGAHGDLVLRVPTFAEILDLVRGLGASTRRCIGIYPEIKKSRWHADHGHDVERSLLAALTAAGHVSRDAPVFVQSFEPKSLMRLRELGCAVRLVQLIGSGKETEAKISPEELDRIAGYADAIGPSLRLLIDARGQTVDGNALVTDAHARGLTVHVWTLRADSLPPFTDDFAALARRVLFDLGADGVFTDHPDLAVRAIRKPPDH